MGRGRERESERRKLTHGRERYFKERVNEKKKYKVAKR